MFGDELFMKSVDNTITYAQAEAEVKEVVVLEVYKRIREAQEAKRSEVEAEAERIKNEFIENKMLEIEAQVRDDFIAEQQAINDSVKEKVIDY